MHSSLVSVDVLGGWLAVLAEGELGESVRVVWRERGEAFTANGRVSWADGRWVIELAEGLSASELLLTLFHECAHVRLRHVARGEVEPWVSMATRAFRGIADTERARREAEADAWARRRVARLGGSAHVLTQVLAGEVA